MLEYMGLRLKEIRKLNKATQVEFAQLLETSQRNISSYENGNLEIPDRVKIKLFNLGINLNWLLTGEGEMFSKPGNSELSETHYDEISDIINILKTMNNDDIRQFGKMVGEWQKLKKELREMKEKLTEMEKILNK